MVRRIETPSYTRAARVMVLVSGAVLGLNLIGGVALARGLGVDGRGQLAALVLWATLAIDFVLVGTTGSTTFHIARFPLHRFDVIRILRRVVPVMGLVGIVVFAGFVAASELSVTRGAVVVFAAYVPLRIVFEQALAVAQGDSRFVRYNMARLLAAGVPAVAFTSAWLAGIMSAEVAGFSYCAAVLAGILAITTHQRRTADAAEHDPPSGGFGTRDYWTYSARNWLAVLAAKSNSAVDVLILSLLATPATLGLYAVSVSAASVLTLVGTAAGIVALPRLAAATGAETTAAIYRKLLSFTIAGSSASAVALLVTAGFIVPAVFGEEFRSAVPLVRILAIAAVGVSLGSFASAVLRSRNMPGMVAIAQGVGMAVTIVVAFAVNPRSGEAVAVASALGYWVSACAQFLAIWRSTAVRNLIALDSSDRVPEQSDGP